MKTLASTLMISLAALAGAAQAADEPVKTRAQVVAELQAAQAQGLVSQGELDYPLAQATDSNPKSRADVQAELAAARSANLISTGELDYPPVAAAESDKSRAQVQAELFDYVSSGQVHQIEA
ncbi:DUF4148 domain-containing protein [Pusillimonas sp. SM2304]|uniref:DUF4148 domain-containing protein n=1 Tax=Pusillimonas sp. SM2304 TaxID=3073241 RepID=UPI002874C8F0|nr:DUF4148 domain-containing protein [Pusillimonas sp. SM2304]MDS1139362.1 DUF4148 domain-containing protein [Pusillimonas sp. SM2304]